jgi:hypothetical protein
MQAASLLAQQDLVSISGTTAFKSPPAPQQIFVTTLFSKVMVTAVSANGDAKTTVEALSLL